MAADATSQIKQFIEFFDAEDGSSTTAVLTLTLPDGTKQVHRHTITDAEMEALRKEAIASELEHTGTVSGVLLLPIDGDGEVGWGFLKSIAKPFKAIGKVAKSIASSKVFSLAATGLAVAAPLLGPLAPAALGAAAGMGIASKLAKAGGVAEVAPSLAGTLTKAAGIDASRLTTTAEGAASLLQVANGKRNAAAKIASESKPVPAKKPGGLMGKSFANARRVTDPKEAAAMQQRFAAMQQRAREPKAPSAPRPYDHAFATGPRPTVTGSGLASVASRVKQQQWDQMQTERKRRAAAAPSSVKSTAPASRSNATARKLNTAASQAAKAPRHPQAARPANSSAQSTLVRRPANVRALNTASAPTLDLLAAARAGRVHSNTGEKVTPAQLLAAHASGRLYWVS